MNIKDAYKKANRAADNLGMPIDTRIRKTVVGLWANGIQTSGSCEGHPQNGLPYPWVDIETDKPADFTINTATRARLINANNRQVKKLKSLIDKFNESRDFNQRLGLQSRGTFGGTRLVPIIAGIDITNEPPAVSQKQLLQMQSVMEEFANFLLERSV